MPLAKSKAWFLMHRALIGAVAITFLLAALVAVGEITAGRAAVTLCFCWMLALHSEDIKDHKAEMIEGFERVAAAGMDARRGDRAGAARQLESAAVVAVSVVKEVEADHASAAAKNAEVEKG